MATMREFDTSDPTMPEVLARTLRHEVGDLLQTIYAAVAILQRRLAVDATLERRVLTDLRSRAEGCKRLLDNMSDLVSSLSLAREQVDLSQLAGSLVATAAQRYPKLEIQANSTQPVLVLADEKRIAQVGEILLNQACEAAQRQVSFQTQRQAATGEAKWTVTDDRPDVAKVEPDELFAPFEKFRDCTGGIELTLAQRLVVLHGGRITTANLPEGGFAIHVWLPANPSAPTAEAS